MPNLHNLHFDFLSLVFELVLHYVITHLEGICKLMYKRDAISYHYIYEIRNSHLLCFKRYAYNCTNCLVSHGGPFSEIILNIGLQICNKLFSQILAHIVNIYYMWCVSYELESLYIMTLLDSPGCCSLFFYVSIMISVFYSALMCFTHHRLTILEN